MNWHFRHCHLAILLTLLVLAVAPFATRQGSLIRGPFQDQGGQVFNVKAYSAVGNGSGGTGTDDSAAIAAVMTAASSAGGGYVYFPPSSGNYEICSASVPLVLPSNVYLWIPNGVILQACRHFAEL